MFRLTKVRIQNFKCFEDTGEIKIEPDCTTLIGMNEAGKSAFLKAIYYLGNEKEIPKDCWRHHEKEPSIISWFDATEGTWLEAMKSGEKKIKKPLKQIHVIRVTRNANNRSIEFLDPEGVVVTDDALAIIYEQFKKILCGSTSPKEEYEQLLENLQEKEALLNYWLILEDEIPPQVTPANRQGCMEILVKLKADIEQALGVRIFTQEAQENLLKSVSGFLTLIKNTPVGTIEASGWVKQFKDFINELETRGDLLDQTTLWAEIETPENVKDIIAAVQAWKYPKKKRLLKALDNLLRSFEIEIPDLKEIVKSSITTIYFDEYKHKLPDSVNIKRRTTEKFAMFDLLLHIGSSSVDELLKLEKGAERGQEIKRAEVEFTKEMIKYWTEKPQKVCIYPAEPEFHITVEKRLDPKSDETFEFPPSELSRGIQWYLGFFTKFWGESDREHKHSILLLDDVAVYLHPSKQKEQLELFKRLSELNQVIYSTHFPYLVPSDLSKIRVCVSDEKKLTTSVVYENYNIAPTTKRLESPDALAPIRLWMGITLGDSLFAAYKTLIVEGVTDMVYLSGLSKYRQVHGLSNIEKLHILPATCADRAVMLGLFLESEKLKYFVLLDSDDEGKEKLKNTRHKHKGVLDLDKKMNVLDKACGAPKEMSIKRIEDFIKVGFPEHAVKRSSRKHAEKFRDFLESQTDDSLLHDPDREKFWKLCDKLFKNINGVLAN